MKKLKIVRKRRIILSIIVLFSTTTLTLRCFKKVYPHNIYIFGDELFTKDEILKNSKFNKKKKFDFLIDEWGCDFQSEHERFLVEKYFNKPVVIFNYPSKSKAFYMRLNDDKKTVAAMDVLFPGIGEIIGGSQREERLKVLKNRMNQFGISSNDLLWYTELRKFGTVPHSGFGLGFERIVLFATGMNNIRDVIPFPRTPNNALF